MNNVLYSRTIVKAKDSADGENPTEVVVTQENNGHAVWFRCADGDSLHAFHNDADSRNAALEEGVDYARKLLANTSAKLPRRAQS
jgi:hypothetical protein